MLRCRVSSPLIRTLSGHGRMPLLRSLSQESDSSKGILGKSLVCNDVFTMKVDELGLPQGDQVELIPPKVSSSSLSSLPFS